MATIITQPRMVNAVNIPVSLGSDGMTYYCGRILGIEMISNSEGQCGPNTGPNCVDWYLFCF